MSQAGGNQYENLDLQSDPPFVSIRHPGGGLSACRFGASSLTIEEKRTPFLTVDEFVGVVKTVLGGLKEDEVPSPFFLQQCRMQCLAQPSNVENSLDLLARRLARVYGAIDPFGRPPAFFGVRFRFPPVILEQQGENPEATGQICDETPTQQGGTDKPASPIEDRPIADLPVEKKGFVTVRFETHTEDITQVWMEVNASYPETDLPLSLKDTARIAENIRETHVFLVDKSKRFLDQFDNKSDNTEEQHGG